MDILGNCEIPYAATRSPRFARWVNDPLVAGRRSRHPSRLSEHNMELLPVRAGFSGHEQKVAYHILCLGLVVVLIIGHLETAEAIEASSRRQLVGDIGTRCPSIFTIAVTSATSCPKEGAHPGISHSPVSQ
jgi:hypothetical protein